MNRVRADQVGGLSVELDGCVVECDLGGLVDEAQAAAAADAAADSGDAGIVAAGARGDEEEEEEAEAAAITERNEVEVDKPLGTFYEALVEVRQTVNNPPPPVTPLKGHQQVVAVEDHKEVEQELFNGTYSQESDGEEKEQTEYETEIEVEEDPETDDYTFIEISVYELREVSEPVHKCEVAKEEEGTKPADCVAVLSQITPDSSQIGENDDEEEEEDSIVENQCVEMSLDLNGNVTEMVVECDREEEKESLCNSPTINGNAKRRRGRGRSQSRRRNRNRNWR